MKKYIFLALMILTACSAPKPMPITKGAPTPPPPPPPKYATIYYEVYDWSKCNGAWTALFSDGKFFLTVESSLHPKEKVILPLNFNGEMKRDKGFLQTPLKLTKDGGELLIINLMDDNNLAPKTIEAIKATEKIGGMIIFKDSRVLFFKNLLEYVTNKPWDKFLNENILTFEGTQPCGSVKYFVPNNPPTSINDAKYLEIKDHGKLKMKLKIYYVENK